MSKDTLKSFPKLSPGLVETQGEEFGKPGSLGNTRDLFAPWQEHWPWLAIAKLALINKGSMTTDDGQWQKFKSPREGPRADSDGPFLARREHVQHTTAEANLAGPQGIAGPCGVRFVCAQAAKGETMRLFLPLCGATISTLRALMGWLLWEPKAADPIPRRARLPTADGYSSCFPAGPDRGLAPITVFRVLTAEVLGCRRMRDSVEWWDLRDGRAGMAGPQALQGCMGLSAPSGADLTQKQRAVSQEGVLMHMHTQGPSNLKNKGLKFKKQRGETFNNVRADLAQPQGSQPLHKLTEYIRALPW